MVQPPKTKKTKAKESPSQEGQGSPETISRDDTLSTPSTSDSDAPLPEAFKYFNIHNMYISFFWGNTIILITFWFQITCIPFLHQHYIPRPDRHIVFLFYLINL